MALGTPWNKNLYEHFRNSDEVHNIPENEETVLHYTYHPLCDSNFNPRYLTLLYDGTNLKAAIGHLREEAGPSVLTCNAGWAGCQDVVLNGNLISQMFTFESNEMHYYSGQYGAGKETLFLQLE